MPKSPAPTLTDDDVGIVTDALEVAQGYLLDLAVTLEKASRGTHIAEVFRTRASAYADVRERLEDG